MAQKNFKMDDVNSLFITPPAEPETPAPVKKREAPASPEKPETKSDRLQLLIYPSVNKALAKEAKRKRISKNDLINQILKTHTEEEQ